MTVKFVQFTSSSASSSLAYVSNNQANDLLIMCVTFTDFGTTQVATCTDTLGNVWNRIAGTALSDPTTPPVQIELWYAQASRVGANTITLTWTGATPATIAMDIAEYKGVAVHGNPVNIVVTNRPAGTTPSIGPFTVTSPGVIVAYVAPVGNVSAGDAGSNFRGSNPIGCGYEDRFVAPGLNTLSFTIDIGPSLIFAVSFNEESANALVFGADF